MLPAVWNENRPGEESLNLNKLTRSSTSKRKTRDKELEQARQINTSQPQTTKTASGFRKKDVPRWTQKLEGNAL